MLTLTAFSWLAVFFGIVVGPWTLFAMTERAYPPLKDKVNHWISTTVKSGLLLSEWSGIFVYVFDALFGQRKFSLRFLCVSFATSICFSVTLLFLWATLYPNEAAYYFTQHQPATLYILAIFFISNLIPDYISNCQTRFIIGKCTQYANNGELMWMWILLDIVLTCLVSLAVIVPLAVFSFDLIVLIASDIFGTSHSSIFDITSFFTLHSSEIFSRHDDMVSGYNRSLTPPYGVFFYSTFLTSIWLWLHIMNALIISAIDRLVGVNTRFLEAKEFRKRPLHWLGGISGAFLGALFLLCTLIEALL